MDASLNWAGSPGHFWRVVRPCGRPRAVERSGQAADADDRTVPELELPLRIGIGHTLGEIQRRLSLRHRVDPSERVLQRCLEVVADRDGPSGGGDLAREV